MLVIAAAVVVAVIVMFSVSAVAAATTDCLLSVLSVCVWGKTFKLAVSVSIVSVVETLALCSVPTIIAQNLVQCTTKSPK